MGGVGTVGSSNGGQIVRRDIDERDGSKQRKAAEEGPEELETLCARQRQRPGAAGKAGHGGRVLGGKAHRFDHVCPAAHQHIHGSLVAQQPPQPGKQRQLDAAEGWQVGEHGVEAEAGAVLVQKLECGFGHGLVADHCTPHGKGDAAKRARVRQLHPRGDESVQSHVGRDELVQHRGDLGREGLGDPHMAQQRVQRERKSLQIVAQSGDAALAIACDANAKRIPQQRRAGLKEWLGYVVTDECGEGQQDLWVGVGGGQAKQGMDRLGGVNGEGDGIGAGQRVQRALKEPLDVLQGNVPRAAHQKVRILRENSQVGGSIEITHHGIVGLADAEDHGGVERGEGGGGLLRDARGVGQVAPRGCLPGALQVRHEWVDGFADSLACSLHICALLLGRGRCRVAVPHRLQPRRCQRLLDVPHTPVHPVQRAEASQRRRGDVQDREVVKQSCFVNEKAWANCWRKVLLPNSQNTTQGALDGQRDLLSRILGLLSSCLDVGLETLDPHGASRGKQRGSCLCRQATTPRLKL
eukprot:m.198731 g.198731  ORF g.198731 m.198731 type:complete len:524 (+) comp15487_c0_seq2:1361-2932(+)